MRSAARSRVGALLLVALIIAAGCGERVDITGTAGAARPGGGTATGGTSGSAIDARLVGQWSRTLLLQDNTGAVHASRTTWRFASDASARRAVVASNLTFGLVDSVVTTARWRIVGGQLALSFLSPAAGDVLFEYRIDGATLYLGGIPFERQ